jgi:hypothetical protein
VPALALHSLLPSSSDALDPSLEDARDSLAYWEARARRLPRHAIRRRREAREMAARWRLRVAEAERLVYGRGLIGALVLLAAERRLPQPARDTARVLARRTAQAAVAVCVLIVALVAAGMVAAIEVLAALVDALG